VYFDSWGNRWRATININGSTKQLGSFKTIEEAAKAREVVEIKYGYTHNIPWEKA